MLTLFIESIKIKNPCQIKPQNLYDKDYQRFIKELGLAGWDKAYQITAIDDEAVDVPGSGRLDARKAIFDD